MQHPCSHKPSKFCFQRAPSDQRRVSAWRPGCFLMANVSFSRLRSISKERGGHPRRSCLRVAARWGNPGQEGRNQGRRANERVSGEVSPFSLSLFSTLLFFVSSSACFLFTSGCLPLFICLYCPLFVFLCLSLPLSVFVLAEAWAPAALTTSSWHRMCACLWLCVIALQLVSVLQQFQIHDI